MDTKWATYVGPYEEVITQSGVVFKQGEAQEVPAELFEALPKADYKEAKSGESKKSDSKADQSSEAKEGRSE